MQTNNIIRPMQIHYQNNDKTNAYINNNSPDALRVSISISDIHFGVLDPEYQYNLLKEQFLNKIHDIPFDVLYINGDLFDRKLMSNTDAVLYASLFISDCVNICRNNNATLLLLHGTESHDNKQLKMFYHYLHDDTVDVRIVETARFEIIKGQRVLCLPEEYNKGEIYYHNLLYHSGYYDVCVLHGMLRGVVYQDNSSGLDSSRAPTFDLDNFINCRGPILAGHVHTPGVYGEYFYYSGSPLRWQHGEEEDKGFLITVSNIKTGVFYTKLEKIYSLNYITINIDYLINKTPDEIIQELSVLKEKHNIHNLRIDISQYPSDVDSSTVSLLKKYYRNNSTVKIQDNYNKNLKTQKEEEYVEKYEELSYLFDKDLSDYEKLARYINNNNKDNESFIMMTADEIINRLKG